MLKKRIIVLVICCSLILCACAPKQDTTLNEATMSALYTAVVQTLSISPQAPSPTPTLPMIATITLIPSATQGLPSATPTRYVATVSSCDNAVYVADVTIPDNTAMSPGQSFTKTWSIKNSGTCEWTTSYKLVFLSGSAMSGVSTNLTSALSAGKADNISVKLVAPTTMGTYKGYWIMQNTAGQTFGQQVYLSIVVSSSLTATPTGTITPTPNLTATAGALSTAYAAATSYAATVNAPTATPVTPTATPVTPTATTPPPTATTEVSPTTAP